MARQEYYQPRRKGRSSEDAAPGPGIERPSGAQFIRPGTNSVYDKEGTDTTLGNIDDILAQQEREAASSTPASGSAAVGGSSYSRDQLGAAEEAPAGKPDTIGGGYRTTDDKESMFGGAAGAALGGNAVFQSVKALFGRFMNIKNKQRGIMIGSIVVAGVGGAAGGFLGLLSTINVFQFDHLLSNMEIKTQVRSEVDLNGRTISWLSAYLLLRMGEVESPELKPEDRNNLVFKGDGTDPAHPLYIWFLLMRGSVSKFEADLKAKEGITFTSVAYEEDGIMKFRTGKITIDDKVYELKLTPAEQKALREGNPNGYNGRLRKFINTEVMGTDKEARKAISDAINRNTKKKQVFKRWIVRKSIMNATGTRNWTFWETKRTPCMWAGLKLAGREECRDLKVKFYNKAIAKATPENLKNGRWAKCTIGLSKCTNSTDRAHPENVSGGAPKTSESCSGGSTDSRCTKNDGSAEQSVTDGLGTDAKDTTKTLLQRLTAEILKKVNVAAGVISVLDTLRTIHNGILGIVSFITNSRTEQVMAAFAMYGIMRDQMKDGSATADEISMGMELFAQNGGYGQIWQEVVVNPETSELSAAATDFEKTDSYKKYCDTAYWEVMTAPANREEAKKSYAWLCPFMKIGGPSVGKMIVDAYNSTIGLIIGPIVKAYEASGIAAISDWVGSGVEWLMQATGLDKALQAVFEGALKALGLLDNFQDMMGFLFTKLLAFIGAGPMLPDFAPPNAWVNMAFLGAAATNEATIRDIGGSATTQQSRMDSQRRVAQYLAEEQESQSFSHKYFALDNHQSAAANALFSLTNQPLGTTLAAAFNSLLNLPATILGGRALAATNNANLGYEVQKMGEIETFDIPQVCFDLDVLTMKPAEVTNADDLKLIDPDQLTWEFLQNKEQFYAAIYASEPADNVAKSVYNCALFDSAVSGSIGALYNSKTLGPNVYGAGMTAAPAQTVTAGDLKSSSVNTPCAQGSTEVTNTTGYTEGKSVEIKLCKIDAPSSSEESKPGSPHYIQGADGKILVNSKASANFVALVNAAKAAGMDVKATSSFRSMAHQQALCDADANCKNGKYTAVAKPGTSNHQLGMAVDFQFDSRGNSMDNCTAVNGKCTAQGDKFWDWLDGNAATHNIVQYSAEFWHWEIKGL